MKIAIGSDHAGFALKEFLKKKLSDSGLEIIDVGTFSEESVDYPDYAEKVGKMVAEKEADFGILVCGTGIGMSIAANKLPGIRAAVCSNLFQAIMARRHNDANVLCIGSRVTGDEHALMIAQTFLSEKFEGGRHQRRVDKISDLEDKISRKGES